MSTRVYFDTSALAKWYLNETRSAEVERYIREHGPVAVSDLTVAEMRSLLARHRREGNITPSVEARVFAVFSEDLRKQHLLCHPLPEGLCAGAVNLLASLPERPLRTLDALHLVIAQEIGADAIATADKVMAVCAKALGMDVVRF